MKRIITSCIMALAMIIALPMITENLGSAKAQTFVTITGNGVRLRTSPSLSANVYTQLDKGAKVKYISTDGDWYCVSYAGQTLYVSRDFATLAGNNGSAKKSASNYKYCLIKAKNLRLRVGPGKDYSYLVWTATGETVHLNHGDVLPFLGEIRNGFCKVRFDGKDVWVAREYVTFK